MKRGVLLIACGPSGVGKTSLGRSVRERHPNLVLSVSYTTRAMRTGERDGVDYHFIDVPTFERLREAGEFAEWANVHDNLYATPKSAIIDAWQRDQDVFFDIDYQGALQLMSSFPEESVAILLAPPNMSILEQRLRGRSTDSEAVIQRRLTNARHELEQFERFDYIVINDDLTTASHELERIYLASRSRCHWA